MYPKATLQPTIPLFFYLSAVLAVLLIFVSSSESKAQVRRAVSGERATCVVKVAGTEKANANSNEKRDININAKPRTHRAELNQIGHFDRIANIAPLETVPVEIFYPDGKPGDQVVIAVQDGGMLDNGNRVKVAKLDNQRKLSFTFQVTDHPGIHRVMLRKDLDSKVVQLWVGPEPAPTKK
jgi:hypothetical protein